MIGDSPSDHVSKLEPAGRFEEVRLDLARLHVQDSLRDSFRELATIAASALEVERVGLWLLEDDGRAIRCHFLWQRSSDEVFEGAMLRACDFPVYFEALRARRAIPAADARTDPLTHELRGAYLDPIGVTAMLDAPVYQRGELAGVICHESTAGTARSWSRAEEGLAASVADAVARLLEEAARRRAEASIASYETRLSELRRFEALGQVAAGVAHDFRSILRAVLGFSEMILERPEATGDVAEYARRIVEAAARGERLTAELVTLARDRPGSPRVLDVAEVVTSLRPMLEALVQPSVELVVRTEPGVSRVLIDRSHLERAVTNLVSNASDAVDGNGRVEVTVGEETVAAADGASYVALSVRDDGCGMPASVRERMFEPFFSTKGDGGTGLGLAVVSQLVSNAGGFQGVESEPGAGTTVKLFLPRIARRD